MVKRLLLWQMSNPALPRVVLSEQTVALSEQRVAAKLHDLQ